MAPLITMTTVGYLRRGGGGLQNGRGAREGLPLQKGGLKGVSHAETWGRGGG